MLEQDPAGGPHYTHGVIWDLKILQDSKAAITFSTITYGKNRGASMHKTLVLEQRGGSTKKPELSEVAKEYLDMKYGRVINVPLLVAD